MVVSVTHWRAQVSQLVGTAVSVLESASALTFLEVQFLVSLIKQEVVTDLWMENSNIGSSPIPAEVHGSCDIGPSVACLTIGILCG